MSIWARNKAMMALLLLLTPGFVGAQDEEEEHPLRFELEGGFLWTETRGYDLVFGDAISTETSVENGAFIQEDTLERLVNELGGEGAPYARFAVQGDRWGASADFWSVGTDASLSGAAEGLDQTLGIWGGRFIEVFDLDYSGRNELSVWSARAAVNRRLPHSLLLSAGVHVASLDLSRAESVNGMGVPDIFPFFDPVFALPRKLSVTTTSRVEGTGAGPFVELGFRGDVRPSLRWTVSGAQSFLFARVNHTSAYSASDVDPSFFFTVEQFMDVDLESSARVVVPVTELRTDLKLLLGDNVAIGVAAFFSLWQDVPEPLTFLVAEGWVERTTNLSFFQIGPVLSISF